MRYQRQYGIHTYSDNSREQMHSNIASQLGGFKSSMAALGQNIAQKQGIVKADRDAREYDPSQPPEMRGGVSAGAQRYNQLVSQSYKQSVQNRAHVRLGELAEQYKNDPSAYAAAVQKRRIELANEAGDVSGVALTAFDTVSSEYERKIRSDLMADAVSVAQTEEGIRRNQAESIVMDYAKQGDADEQVIAGLIQGYDEVVLGSEFTSDPEKQKALIAIRHKATEQVYKSELNDYLDSGDVKGAVKWIDQIRRRQITDGKMSKIMAETGQTPEQLAETLQIELKAHGQRIAEGIDQEAKVRADEEVAREERDEEVKKALIDLGLDLTVDDVKEARGSLDPTEYRELMELAKGKQPDRDTVDYNQLYADVLSSHAEEDYDAMRSHEAVARELLIAGRISKTEYDSILDEVKSSRFDAGQAIFEGLSKTTEALGDMAVTMSLVKARNDYQRWKKLNPDSSPQEAEAKAEDFINQRAPNMLRAVKGMEEAMLDEQQTLLNKYLNKHGGNKQAVLNDPEYLKEKIALDEQK